jgi:hypothetical protein
MEDNLVDLLYSDRYCARNHAFDTKLTAPDGRVLELGMLFKEYNSIKRPTELLTYIVNQARQQGVVIAIGNSYVPDEDELLESRSPFVHYSCHKKRSIPDQDDPVQVVILLLLLFLTSLSLLDRNSIDQYQRKKFV